MTARLDVTRLRAECDRFGVHFYAAFIWCTSNVVNRLPFMKMMTDEEGNPGVWDVVHPNYTIFHKEDHTFSDCWSEYDADFATFYKRIETDIEAAKKVRGVKAKAGQPVNFYCISCVPWLDYTGYATSIVSDHVALFPIITFGKYTEDNGKLTLPLTLTIAHAAMDGWHTSEFVPGDAGGVRGYFYLMHHGGCHRPEINYERSTPVLTYQQWEILKQKLT